MKKFLILSGTLAAGLLAFNIQRNMTVVRPEVKGEEMASARPIVDSPKAEAGIPKPRPEAVVKEVPAVAEKAATIQAPAPVAQPATAAREEPRPDPVPEPAIEQKPNVKAPQFNLYSDYMLSIDSGGKSRMASNQGMSVNGISPQYIRKRGGETVTLYGAGLGNRFYPTYLYFVQGCSPFVKSPSGNYIDMSSVSKCQRVTPDSTAPDASSLTFTVPVFYAPDASTDSEGNTTYSYTVIAVRHDAEKDASTDSVHVFRLPVAME